MRKPRPSARLLGRLAIAILVAWMLASVGCALYREDRSWVSPDEYALARDMFLQAGSLDLVHKRLNDMDWETGKINETLYRLRKEFEVLPEGALGARRAPEPAAAVTPANPPSKPSPNPPPQAPAEQP
jgi:hypothetical protein